MDLILKFLHIPSLCIDYNPIMDCNASDLIMWLLAVIFQNLISIHINIIIVVLYYIKYFLFYIILY